jgi:hypothetical protein
VEFEVRITCITDYIDLILNQEKQLVKNPIRYETMYFRGHSNKEYKLLPSLARNRTLPCDISILNQERNMIEECKFKMPHIFNNTLCPINLLALLQHWGIPTRLMDITINPLVALYFAVSRNEDKDGEVLIFIRHDKEITQYPIYNAVAETYKFAHTTMQYLSFFYDDMVLQPYFLEQKNTCDICYTSKEEKENWISDCCNRILYVNAGVYTERQHAQKGSYILFNNDIEEDEKGKYFIKVISEIPKDKKHICRRVLIPKENKSEILSNLETLGITKSNLFPENIDIICDEIKHNAMKRVN